MITGGGGAATGSGAGGSGTTGGGATSTGAGTGAGSGWRSGRLADHRDGHVASTTSAAASASAPTPSSARAAADHRAHREAGVVGVTGAASPGRSTGAGVPLPTVAATTLPTQSSGGSSCRGGTCSSAQSRK